MSFRFKPHLDQPSSSNGVQCSLALENSTKWYSKSCDSRHPYICQLNSTSSGDSPCNCPTCPTVATCPTPKPPPKPTCPPPQTGCSPGWTYSNVTKMCYYVRFSRRLVYGTEWFRLFLVRPKMPGIDVPNCTQSLSPFTATQRTFGLLVSST